MEGVSLVGSLWGSTAAEGAEGSPSGHAKGLSWGSRSSAPGWVGEWWSSTAGWLGGWQALWPSGLMAETLGVGKGCGC